MVRVQQVSDVLIIRFVEERAKLVHLDHDRTFAGDRRLARKSFGDDACRRLFKHLTQRLQPTSDPHEALFVSALLVHGFGVGVAALGHHLPGVDW